jgi:hypothetical protein
MGEEGEGGKSNGGGREKEGREENGENIKIKKNRRTVFPLGNLFQKFDPLSSLDGLHPLGLHLAGKVGRVLGSDLVLIFFLSEKFLGLR